MIDFKSEISKDQIDKLIQKRKIALWDPRAEQSALINQIPDDLVPMIEEGIVTFGTITGTDLPNAICTSGVKVWNRQLAFSAVYMNLSLRNVKEHPYVIALANNSLTQPRLPIEEVTGFRLLGRARVYRSGSQYDRLRTLDENEGYHLKAAIIVTVGAIIKSW